MPIWPNANALIPYTLPYGLNFTPDFRVQKSEILKGLGIANPMTRTLQMFLSSLHEKRLVTLLARRTGNNF